MSLNENSISLRKLTWKDLPEAMRLKNAEGWNQTEKDWEVFVNGSQNINFVAEAGEKTVGTLTAINYGNDVAWLGMMIVDRSYRGLGISKNLMTTAIETLIKNQCKSIKLDATPAGRPVYVKLGFVEEYTIFRLVHPGLEQPVFPDADTDKVVPVTEKDLSGIVDLDTLVFGANRSELIRHLILHNPEKSFVLKERDKVTGFALGRDGTRFIQIGPVVAGNDADAAALVQKALDPLKGEAVVMDVLGKKDHLLKGLIQSGFENQRPLYRMFLKDNPFPGKPEQLYAICGPEFG